MLFRSGGWVLARRPTNPFETGIIKKAFISACSRRSSLGTRSIRPEMVASAEASADGRPVMVAAPRSAANSRYRDSARMRKKETTHTTSETTMATITGAPLRYREFAADRGAATITGRPSALASALATISGRMDRVPEEDLREQAEMNAFFIIPISTGFIGRLARTHPPTEKRIEQLQELEREMETVA